MVKKKLQNFQLILSQLFCSSNFYETCCGTKMFVVTLSWLINEHVSSGNKLDVNNLLTNFLFSFLCCANSVHLIRYYESGRKNGGDDLGRFPIIHFSDNTQPNLCILHNHKKRKTFSWFKFIFLRLAFSFLTRREITKQIQIKLDLKHFLWILMVYLYINHCRFNLFSFFEKKSICERDYL